MMLLLYSFDHPRPDSEVVTIIVVNFGDLVSIPYVAFYFASCSAWIS